jgi:hypothetical protein
MVTKKITLNELRTLVKQIIKEENIYNTGFYDDIDGDLVYISDYSVRNGITSSKFTIENDYRILKDNLSFDEIKKYINNNKNNKIVFNDYTGILQYVNNEKDYKDFVFFTNLPFYYENRENYKILKQFIKYHYPNILKAWELYKEV